MKYQTIEQLISDRKYETPDSYIGPDYFGYISLIGQTRDSGCLERSNFECALEMLGYDWNRGTTNDGDDSVVVSRASHWLCGWVNVIYVKCDSLEKINIAMDILNSLDDYPVLDDDHFLQLEQDELADLIKNNMEYFERDFAQYLGKETLNRAEKLFIEYSVECDAGWCGHESAYFGLDYSQMKRTIEFINDNRLSDDSFEMKALLEQLELSLEFEKLAA